MAIFGNFNEIPFSEVITLLGQRSGRLEVWKIRGRHSYELHVHAAVLTGMLQDGRPLTHPLQVRHHFLDLATAQNGAFEFNRSEPERLRQDLNLQLSGLLLSATTVMDEIDHYRAHLDSPDTRYRLLHPHEGVGVAALDDFVRHAAPLLGRGASAREIAQTLQLSLEQVQLNLYKLRTLGRAVPLRAHTSVSADELRTGGAGLIRRLLKALLSGRQA
ncbi:hypothetical protein HNR42_001916 [Deinobacterium chartae]|uniref:DUF4388 domain-containing protein n=1 Tax=Deinobacterium chartae TaxID=521158 RepID=A0A841I374_9DEIO|nr:DUF4388 domain-containing protein [Deinobacterium chartae]MBB6098482.1 hypothetical protein [Deinobacterium chartae]